MAWLSTWLSRIVSCLDSGQTSRSVMNKKLETGFLVHMYIIRMIDTENVNDKARAFRDHV